jgi:hypothetical protein
MALMPPPITSEGRAALVAALRTLTRFEPFGRYAPRARFGGRDLTR